MKISQIDKEVKDLIDQKSIYGLEMILNATMRVVIGRPYIDREYIHRLVDAAIDRAITDYEETV